MNKILIGFGVVVLIGIGVWAFGSGGGSPSPSASPQTAYESVPPTSTPATSPTQQAGAYTMTEVAQHTSQASCYTVIRGSVYDLTKWIAQHPGGERAILKICGTDGTSAFVDQHGGRSQQENILATFKIGTVIQ